MAVIGAACGAGAPDPGTTEGPDALRRYRAFHDTPLQHVAWEAILRVPRGARDTPLHAVAALARLADDPAFLAMEIAEYNPRRDHGYATARAVGALVDPIAPCTRKET